MSMTALICAATPVDNQTRVLIDNKTIASVPHSAMFGNVFIGSRLLILTQNIAQQLDD